jgi:hypothetical protein
LFVAGASRGRCRLWTERITSEDYRISMHMMEVGQMELTFLIEKLEKLRR